MEQNELPVGSSVQGENDEIANLIASLHGNDEDGRRRAVQALAALGHSAVPALLKDMAGSRLNGWLRASYLFVMENEADTQAIAELSAVHEALRGTGYRSTVPIAAEQSLSHLQQESAGSA